MNDQLNNTVTALGSYNAVPTSLTSDVVTVALVSGLTLTKAADKQSWADGYLTYTITLDNKAASSYTTPVITDVIDTTLVTFVDGSVKINGTVATSSQYKYDTGSHTLTVNLEDVAASTSTVVTFQVSKNS